jgi:hypothetical protein
MNYTNARLAIMHVILLASVSDINPQKSLNSAATQLRIGILLEWIIEQLFYKYEPYSLKRYGRITI